MSLLALTITIPRAATRVALADARAVPLELRG